MSILAQLSSWRRLNLSEGMKMVADFPEYAHLVVCHMTSDFMLFGCNLVGEEVREAHALLSRNIGERPLNLQLVGGDFAFIPAHVLRECVVYLREVNFESRT